MPPVSDDLGGIGQAPECKICPLCTALAALREARPEAVEHLVKAGAELLLAARALLDETASEGPPQRRGRSRRSGAPGAAAGDGLQRIDIG
jgi:hypothetical protein